MQTQPVVDTKPLLRPDQLQNAKEEIASLEAKLQNPLIQDKGQVRKQLLQARKLTEAQTPLPPQNGEEADRLVRRERELLDTILHGMPSQEEMRKSPPGAIDKHMRWERANKTRILEWKNIRLRLTAGSDDREAANLEKHRPTSSTLNMDNALIPGKQFFMPETSGPAVTFNDAQLALLRQLSPQLADMIGLMSNDQRSQVKETISGIGLVDEKRQAASAAGKRGVQKREAKKRRLSEEHKQKLREGAQRAREAKTADKPEVQP